MQTDGHTDMMKLTVTFRNFEKAPENLTLCCPPETRGLTLYPPRHGHVRLAHDTAVTTLITRDGTKDYEGLGYVCTTLICSLNCQDHPFFPRVRNILII